MKILRKIKRVTKLDRIRSEEISKRLKLKNIITNIEIENDMYCESRQNIESKGTHIERSQVNSKRKKHIKDIFSNF